MRVRFLLLAVLIVLPAEGQHPEPGILGGLEFRTIGPAVMSGRIVDLAVVEKDPFTFYVASATGGVWKTTNNGVTFEPVFQDEPVHSVGAIAVHQAADSVIWVGTGERANRQSSSWGNGVYRSTDAGASWQHLGLDESRHIGRIALHPDDPNVAYVAAMGHLWGPNEERGLYRTTDGGASWERILFIDSDTGVVDVAMDPSNPSVLYAAAYQRRRRAWGFHGGGPGSGLYKSTDGGETWSRLTDGLPDGDLGRIGISIYRTNPDVVYASVEQGWRYNASTAYEERRAGVYRSENGGESWVHRSDWNPRPMYASQILVDPNDDQRVYMTNSFSFSDDGGTTFTSARQSLHGDDRIVWVNPRDSRHVMKGDDGGLGISYDRAKTWLFVTSLPVSQFYRVGVDNQDPYWVYGGLQDNGSWAAPNETYRTSGVLSSDWIKTGGGDGFVNLVDPGDPTSLYTESQYLGLSVLNLQSGQRRTIRPDNATGRIGPRRNWDAWGPGEAEPELGNAMAPANWDGPFVFSTHSPNTLYAGTNILWKSVDGGGSWAPLGDLTSGTDRRWLSIMGQVPHDSTLSLDDGIPYWPTISAVAESPMVPGRLYAGTDDGQLQISEDDGGSWVEVSSRLPGLPADAWISGIEASAFHPDRVYVVSNDYRSDDYGNYLHVSDDAGVSWRSLTSHLPPDRVLRTIREDPRNPNLLYVGAEIGLFLSLDAGEHWTEMKNGMPTVAVNDLLVHPRDNDLVVATHGRGIWILDDLGSLQAFTPEVMAAGSHLFQISDARQIRERREGAHTGDMYYRGQNPDRGAVIDYFLGESLPKDQLSLEIRDPSGALVRTLEPDTSAGLRRVHWDLRYSNLLAVPQDTSGGRPDRGRGRAGAWVPPGRYQVELSVSGTVHNTWVRVQPDPRELVSVASRAKWQESLADISSLYEQVILEAEPMLRAGWHADALTKDGADLDGPRLAAVQDATERYSELIRRIGSLYGEVSGWTGPLTADQDSQQEYFREMQQKLLTERDEVLLQILPRLNDALEPDQRFTIPDL